ncbi:hypothetical protein ACFWCF_05885 [Rhodococcus sp. NPDC060090]|uniref:hypothetical protein n=1 Tax=Rhodococcus sp. NPDC060090 TaxID=3347056 RepID=UPI0036522C52
MPNDALRVDLDRLTHLSGRLDQLARSAETLKVVPQEAWIGAPATCLSSLQAVISISTDLLDTALVAAVTERFEETADVMRQAVVQYRNADDDAVEQLAATYLSATGTWTTSNDA